MDDLGNGLLIPAGPLRESIAQGLRRADAVVSMTGDALPGFAGPVLRARLVADGAGIDHVLVNGQFIRRAGTARTGVGAGRVLRSST